jgi:agmatinase
MISKNLLAVRPGFGGFDEPYDVAEVAFAGVPLDLTSSYRSGSRFAPARIRGASMNLESYLMPRLDVYERLHISDVGDLDLAGADMETAGGRIEEVVSKLREDGKVPALLGGEHTLTCFALKAFEDVYVLQLDAHRDLRQEYRDESICHATVMRRVLDEFPPERLIQLGTRSCSKEEDDFAREAGVRTFTTEQVLDDPQSTVGKVRDLVGVATPEPGGLSTLDLIKLVRELGKLDIRGFDLVEFAAPYDDGTTAFAAAKIIYELLAAIAESRSD